ncbi:hypothetical protein EBU95_21660 [bacterium]|nr:hypothetical protein [bacterium]
MPILNNVAEFLQGIDAIKPQVIDIPEKTRENLKLSTLLPVLEAHLSEQEYQTIKDNILGDFIKEKDVTSNIS